jgi:hypothetical protein
MTPERLAELKALVAEVIPMPGSGWIPIDGQSRLACAVPELLADLAEARQWRKLVTAERDALKAESAELRADWAKEHNEAERLYGEALRAQTKLERLTAERDALKAECERLTKLCQGENAARIDAQALMVEAHQESKALENEVANLKTATHTLLDERDAMRAEVERLRGYVMDHEKAPVCVLGMLVDERDALRARVAVLEAAAAASLDCMEAHAWKGGSLECCAAMTGDLRAVLAQEPGLRDMAMELMSARVVKLEAVAEQARLKPRALHGHGHVSGPWLMAGIRDDGDGAEPGDVPFIHVSQQGIYAKEARRLAAWLVKAAAWMEGRRG